MTRAETQARRIRDLCDGFDTYVEGFDRRPPFRRQNQLALHE